MSSRKSQSASRVVDVRVLTDGLFFPEGPVACEDGSMLLTEVEGQRLTRVSAEGKKTCIAHLTGGPAGMAIGPDGRAYVCNNGGMHFHRRGDTVAVGHAIEGRTGWIEAVDLSTGAVQRLYDHCGEFPLRAPNDIVFDAHGGFWFTDMGKTFKVDVRRDRGAVYYAQPDASSIRRVIFPMEGPNGIALSSDGATLYVAESTTARLWSFDIKEPGHIDARNATVPWEKGRMLWAADYYSILDSMAVDSAGNICIADIPFGGVVVVSPAGKVVGRIATGDPVTTNICFGGPERQTAYMTLSSTGRLAAMPWSGFSEKKSETR